MKRLFIAVELPEEVKTELTATQKDLGSKISGAKWVDASGLHLTLKFLGYVEEQVIPDIQAVLEEAVRNLPGYRFDVDGLGGFPTKTRPRVVWAGISDRGETANLAAHVERSMEWLGFKPEDRDFHPHVTLARIKNPRRLDDPETLAEAGRGLKITGVEAKGVVLFESRLSPRGATYAPVFKAGMKKS